MGKTDKQRIGALGEGIAAEYLRAKGYCIAQQNARSRAGEIDIIARAPGGGLCFVEVKAVEVASFDQELAYDPVDKLSVRKLGRLARSIEHYCQEQGITDAWQLDAVVVYVNPHTHQARCKHYEHISRE